MRKMLLHLSVGLVTLCAGLAFDAAFNAFEPAFNRYLAPAQETINYGCVDRIRVVEFPPSSGPKQQATPHSRKSLPAELQRIDELYGRRCHMPTDWYGDWPTIAQLDRFKTCNDEWARARRKAIEAELNRYMVRY